MTGKYMQKMISQLLLMFYILKKEIIYHAYVLKHNSNREKEITLLIFPNGERWPYITTKQSSALLREITSKPHGDFYCPNCL